MAAVSKSGSAPPQLLAVAEGVTSAVAQETEGLRGGSLRTPAGDINWDEIWRRMPQPLKVPPWALGALNARINGGEPAAPQPITQSAATMAVDKRVSATPHVMFPEAGQQAGGGAEPRAQSASTPQSAPNGRIDAGEPAAPQPITPSAAAMAGDKRGSAAAAQRQMLAALALSSQGTFGDTVLQGDGVRGSKSYTVTLPSGAGAAAAVAASGLVSTGPARLVRGSRVQVLGERGSSLPLAAQIAASIQRSDVATQEAGVLLAESRRDREEAAALGLEARKAAIPPEPLIDMSPLSFQRIEGDREALAARAVDHGLSSMAARNKAEDLLGEAKASDDTVLRLTTRWLAQEPGPMEGATLLSALVEGSAASRIPAGRPDRPTPGPQAPPAVPVAPSTPCCASCAAAEETPHEPPKRTPCACGASVHSTKVETPPAHWSPEKPAVGPETAPAAGPRIPSHAPGPVGPLIVPETAVLRCREKGVLRPRSSFVDCDMLDQASSLEGMIVEPPQAVSFASSVAGAPPRIDRASSALPPRVAGDSAVVPCRSGAATRLPAFSWNPTCRDATLDVGPGGSAVMGPMQDPGHQGGGSKPVYRPPRQCHCECDCKFGGSGFVFAGHGFNVITELIRKRPVGPHVLVDRPPGGPFPPGHFPYPIGGCVLPPDACMSSSAPAQAVIAGDVRPAVMPPQARVPPRVDQAAGPQRWTTEADWT